MPAEPKSDDSTDRALGRVNVLLVLELVLQPATRKYVRTTAT
jgi:hypothetical protein